MLGAFYTHVATVAGTGNLLVTLKRIRIASSESRQPPMWGKPGAEDVREGAKVERGGVFSQPLVGGPRRVASKVQKKGVSFASR